jgi:genome maintenance exonuclease 1
MIAYEPRSSLPSVERVEVNGKRFYKTPAGNLYPSVTTILDSGDKTFLNEWKARVGEDEARRISARAASRGTRLHAICEDYIKGNSFTLSPFDKDTWLTFKPVVDRIERVVALETQLFSDKLRVAGTVDCVGVYNGKMSIIDFKTSKRLKSKTDIPNYFMQTAAYACAWYEMTGEKINQLVILMSVDDESPQVFIETASPWLVEFAKLRKAFDSKRDVV